MGALLQLITPSPVALPAMMQAATQHQPRVLTDSFRERLALLNHAERELRGMGLHVVWSRIAGPKPQAHIQRDTTRSIAPLLNRMGPRSFRDEAGCKLVSGEFEGVIVSWVEPS